MQYSVLIQYDVVDDIFVASVPELLGCIAHDIILHKPHPRNELKPYQVNHVLDVLVLEGKI